MSKGSVSAADLMQQLADDPDYQQRKQAREAELKQLHQARVKEQAELLQAINTAGYAMASVWDLLNTKDKYPDLLPLLLTHMDMDYSDHVKEGIIRALGVKWVKSPEVIARLFEGFKTEENDLMRWAMANSLSIIISKKADAEQAMALLQQRKYGQSRDQLIHAVARLYKQAAVEPLLALMDDETLTAELIIALGKLKNPLAKPYIEPFVKHKDSWIRQKAKAAMKKLA